MLAAPHSGRYFAACDFHLPSILFIIVFARKLFAQEAASLFIEGAEVTATLWVFCKMEFQISIIDIHDVCIKICGLYTVLRVFMLSRLGVKIERVSADWGRVRGVSGARGLLHLTVGLRCIDWVVCAEWLIVCSCVFYALVCFMFKKYTCIYVPLLHSHFVDSVLVYPFASLHLNAVSHFNNGLWTGSFVERV